MGLYFDEDPAVADKSYTTVGAFLTDFQFAPGLQSVSVAGGTVTLTGLTNITGGDGKGTVGAVADPAVAIPAELTLEFQASPAEVSLGEVTAIAQPDGSDERLVAVAVLVNRQFGTTSGWQGFCEVTGGLGPDHYADGAAIGTATVHILEAGTNECPEVPGIADKRGALFSPPSCGTE